MDPSTAKFPGTGTGAEIIPVKDSHTSNMLFSFIYLVYTVGGLVPFMININHLRIKPLPVANGHDRYIPLHPNGHVCPSKV